MHAKLDGGATGAPGPDPASPGPTASQPPMTDVATALGALQALSPEQRAAVVALIAKTH
jgi:hypothetical protein